MSLAGTSKPPLWRQVKQLYKQLLYVGKGYPAGYVVFKPKLKEAFMKNKHLTDTEEIKKAILQGKWMYKELEALQSLRKYRAIKQRYGGGQDGL